MRRWMVAALLLVAIAVQVEATFASSTGFSGHNVDCTVCHGGAAPAAEAHLEGAPDAWRPGQTYALEASVTGGPSALPDPQPKGGFELEAEAGTLAAGPGMDGLLRFPEATTATYRPAGTLRRDWSLTWTAPPAHQPPEDVRLWLAVMAANGNHVVATNTSDGGEQGDAVATLVATIPAAPDVVAAWQALPLRPPVIDRVEALAEGVRLLGHHGDSNATHLAYRPHGGTWQEQATEATWSLRLDSDAARIELRSTGHGRVSEAVAVATPAKATSWPGGLLLLALLATTFAGNMRENDRTRFR